LVGAAAGAVYFLAPAGPGADSPPRELCHV